LIPRRDLSPEYVQARRVLLDALDGLGRHQAAVVLAGAQAIYLRTGPASLGIAEYTTDGDLAIDPELLEDAPPLGELMETAGFRLATFQGFEEPGIWRAPAEVNGREVMIPVDLIVPAGVAPPGGTRGARLGTHGKRAARKTVGLEAALVDNDVMPIEALDPADRRRSHVRVAGTAALLVAKAHKLNDRVEGERNDRLDDKDASDVVRLLQTSSSAEVASTLSSLLDHPSAGQTTEQALEWFRVMFGGRAGIGIEMAARALRGAMPEERVRAICLSYSDELFEAISR
jgi:ribosomal protein L11